MESLNSSAERSLSFRDVLKKGFQVTEFTVNTFVQIVTSDSYDIEYRSLGI